MANCNHNLVSMPVIHFFPFNYVLHSNKVKEDSIVLSTILEASVLWLKCEQVKNTNMERQRNIESEALPQEQSMAVRQT